MHCRQAFDCRPDKLIGLIMTQFVDGGKYIHNNPLHISTVKYNPFVTPKNDFILG